MKRFGGLAGGVALMALAWGCGQTQKNGVSSTPTPSPTPSSFALESGTYDYLIHTVPADTCWAPPKTNPPVPSTMVADVAVSGNDVTVTPQIDGVPPQSYDIVKNENALTAQPTSQDVDLSGQGLDCVLNVAGTFDATMTADDVFEAAQTITLSEVSGAACFLLVGSTDDNQVDQLPCSFTINATGTIQPQ